jgi:hypothetical protein
MNIEMGVEKERVIQRGGWGRERECVGGRERGRY